ncbi:SPS1 Serine threonine protein kinase [Pyrenophora tritici-repentis]|uniref:non-specific serine/threonine protein kinase n=2 Tax=Pyrenophora tritici-repentis TaxID=45151 RepID=A0A2W1FYF8_9PLEO|nr:protein kinase kin1 [Pyrenophora tritici-repentis Pt-1C-BFP]KAA8625378.1 Protein kinase kin1 [Pyrenophora tritici-repentis]EDU40189.1 protein kinase kin1 [Pyrenophora tritici-repentis Pt-1C-BFP]KAF7453777.1 Protein kinase kin1 [Pyrenophora tritici-repentis]KAF7576869.1 SPS1, Serine-threonine protein kinase [Pyrenophora tritici-repentis]KAG9387537.1 Protein kinase kin1 [Pyrenophora tritici-repentis]
MSAAAPTSPAVVRTPSTSRRSVDRPHRSQSTATRPAGHPPQRHPQPALNNVARRDYEQSNVAQEPNVNVRRSEDPSRKTHSRYASDASTTSAMPINGVAADSRTGQPQPVNKRRTTITAPSTGTWALGKTIGAGSMGKVKLAKNAETGEQAAVKIVPRQSQDQHQSAADRERADHSKEVRTAREAAIVSLLNHPYICGMKDVVRTNFHWYMMFEFVNGGQMLDYIISHGRLKEKQARKFARQIASALDYCHRNSIVHRDLKIENILISKMGDIKIIDFGLSNLFSPRNQLKTFCGSLYFAAPELLQAKQYTGPEVDVWSFGIVLYVLVCGKVPFDDQSMPQLHAKIKKGHVDYPPWLSAECRNLIHRMLQTDPTQRLTLSEIMSHPWLTKGFNSPPENYLPQREPVQLPLDPEVIEKMQGFDFGTTEYITTQLTNVIQSEEYQRAVRVAARKATAQTPETEKKRGMFDFYKRRNSIGSREQLATSSSEDIQRGLDPVNAYSPLLSVYFLVREKMEREQLEANPGPAAMPQAPDEKSLKMPDLPAPPAAYTNSAAYEMAGENPTGGRSRPRARTHGEDDITESLKRMDLNNPPPVLPPQVEQPKKEGAAVGLLRRFSTRKYRSHDKERVEPLPPPPPAVAISGPSEPATPATVSRKSFSIRRPRDREVSASHLPTSANNQPELLSPPESGSSTTRKLKALGRSTSVNSADLRRRLSRRGRSSEDPGNPPPTSGSDRSELSGQKVRVANDAASDDLSASPRLGGGASRAKSLGHARRESIQARRAKREQVKEANVPEETDAELAEAQAEASRSPDAVKPVFLKGLFSVSTTSTKPLPVIQDDLIRVLDQLGVEWTEIKGGFRCRHAPSINMTKPMDSPASPPSVGHRRRISFGGLMGGDKDRDEFRNQHRAPNTPTSRSRPSPADRSYTNTDESDGSEDRDERRPRRAIPAGETSTHVQTDMGSNMNLVFEILIVKVPLLTLHGIQFKKVDGGTWQYKNMAQTILAELRL